MLLLLTKATAGSSTATTGLAVRCGIVAPLIATKRLSAGDAIAGSELDFQLDDFVPLLIAPITLGDRKKLTQATPVV